MSFEIWKINKRKEVVWIINRLRTFATWNNEDRKQARYFKKLFNKRKNIGVWALLSQSEVWFFLYLLTSKKNLVLSFLEEKYTNFFLLAI